LLLKNFDYFSKYSRKFSYFEWVVYSLPVSFIVYFVTDFVLPITYDIEVFLFYYIGFFLLSLFLAFDVGIFIKYFFRRKHTSKESWNSFVERNVSKFVILNTIDGKRYQGYIKHATINFEKTQDIILGNPALLESDTRIEIGMEIFFPMKTIHSILAQE